MEGIKLKSMRTLVTAMLAFSNGTRGKKEHVVQMITARMNRGTNLYSTMPDKCMAILRFLFDGEDL